MLAEKSQNNSNVPNAGASDNDLIEAAENKKRNRMREGTEITDIIGSFTSSGERWTFENEKKKEKQNTQTEEQGIQVLENLMLERVVQTIENSTGTVTWKVSGKITEYRGNNFLILKYVKLNGRK